ncbi:translocation/assembly module TamB domain-containing protein [Roseivivax sp. CAU 1753]
MRHLPKAILAAFLCLAGPVHAQQETERGRLEALIEDNLSGEGFQVDIVGFEGALSSKATMDELTIADADGVWLTLRGVVLDWNRAALLRGRVSVEELVAEEILIPRLPGGAAAEQTELPDAEAKPFSLPELPVSVQIGRIAAERVELGAPLLGEAAVVSLEGSASLEGGEGNVSLAVERLDRGGTLSLTGSFLNETGILSIDLALDEPEGGIAAKLIGLPGEPAVAVLVKGEGPLSDFAADIVLATDNAERITGTVAVKALEGDASGTGFAAEIAGDIRPLLTPENRAFFGDNLSLTVAGQSLASGALTIDTLTLASDGIQLDGNLALGPDKWPERILLTGRVSGPQGQPIQLPIPGAVTRVDGAELNVRFDASEGDGWQAEVMVQGFDQPTLAAGQMRLVGDGTLRRGDGNAIGRVEGAFEIAAEGLAFADPALAEAVGDRLNGALEFSYQENEVLRLTGIDLRGAGATLSGALEIGGITNDLNLAIDGDVQLETDDIARFSGLAGRELSGGVAAAVSGRVEPLSGAFDAAITGTVRDLVTGIAEADRLLDGATELGLSARRDGAGILLRSLTVDAPEASLEASGRLGGATGNADIALTVGDIAEILPELSGALAFTGTVRNEGDDWTVLGDVTGPGRTKAIVDAALQLVKGQIQAVGGKINADVGDLSAYSEIAGRPLGGSITVEAEGSADLKLATASIAATGAVRDPVTGIAEADRLLAGRTAFTIDGAKTVDGFILRTLDVVGERLSVDAEGAYLADDSQARFDIRLNDLADVVPAMSGNASVTGTASQTGEDWDIALSASGPGGLLADIDATAVLQEFVPKSVAGKIDVTIDALKPYATLAGRPLGGGVTLEAEGDVDLEALTGTVTATGAVRDPITGIAEADRLLAGRTSFSFDGTRSTDGVILRSLDVVGERLSVDAAGTYLADDSQAQFDIRLNDLADVVPSMSGNASVTGTASQTGEDWAIALNASGPGGLLADVDATAVVREFVPQSLAGNVDLSINTLRPYAGLVGRPLAGSVNASANGSYDLTTGAADVTLDAEAASIATGITAVDQLLRGGVTDLSLRGGLTEGGLIRIDALDLDAPQIDARASGVYSTDGSQIIYAVRLADIGLFVPDFNGPATAEGNATSSGGDWQINTDLTAPGGTRATVRGSVAADASTANLDINGSAPLGLANPFLEPNLIGGIATFDLAVNGPPGLAALSGRITTQGAQLTIPSQNLALDGIAAEISLNGAQAQIELTGDVVTGGDIRVSGPVGLSAPFNGDLTIRLDDVIVADPGLYQTDVDGTLRLVGPLASSALLSGRIELDQTEIRVPSGGGITTLGFPVTHVGASSAVRQTLLRAGLETTPEPERATGGGLNYGLDLTISAPSRIFIRGRGLDAEVGGELVIGGTIQNIVPRGRFELVRGRLDILGQRIELDEATVSLQGDFNPRIRVVAETAAGDTLIQVIIEGPVSEPEVTFSSTPERPQEEVLSLLLFGRDLSEISALQALRIASAINTLSGRGGPGISETLRANTGLDNLDLQTGEDGGAAVSVGKYIGENAYTDVTVNSTGETEINLNLNLSKSITARGTVTSTGNTGVGIYYEKDY